MTMLRFLLALLVLLSTSSLATAKDARPRQAPPAPRGTEAKPPAQDSRRAQLLDRAREEIRKNPSQKKFILFRHGITEDDLR